MDYSRDMVEQIVIGTLLNDLGEDKFFAKNRMALRKELFKDRKNAFIFGIIQRMHEDGIEVTSPSDVFAYTNKNNIQYGNVSNFVTYMCELSQRYYAFGDFSKYVRELVDAYVKEKRYGTTR